jgi:hypothetical protein
MTYVGHSFRPPVDEDAEDEDQTGHRSRGSSLDLEIWLNDGQVPGHAGGRGGGGGGDPSISFIPFILQLVMFLWQKTRL